MRKDILLYILLIMSISLLFPIFEQKQKITILPNQSKSFIYNLHNPNLEITFDKKSTVIVNITKIGNDKAKQQIYSNQISNNKLIVSNLKPGLYNIVVQSEITLIAYIRGTGIYNLNIIIIIILLLMDIYLLYNKYQ